MKKSPIDSAIERADLEQLRSFARICAYQMFPNGDPDNANNDEDSVCGSDAIAEISYAVTGILCKPANTEPIPTPGKFAVALECCICGDQEGDHEQLDGEMEALLRQLGYGKAMNVFSKASKWYA